MPATASPAGSRRRPTRPAGRGGSLYPRLYRMTQKRWIKGAWGVSENNRRAKFYHLTPAGQREFEQQANGWLRLSQAVSRAVTAVGLPVARGPR